jgi:hypothetical protein
MKTHTEEQLNTQTYVQEDVNNSQSGNTELVEQKEIENTPFMAVRMEDKWFLTLGKYRLTEPLKTEEEVIESAKDATWERIMQVMKIMIIEEKQENK